MQIEFLTKMLYLLGLFLLCMVLLPLYHEMPLLDSSVLFLDLASRSVRYKFLY